MQRVSSLISLALACTCGATLAPSTAAQCVTGGGGGAYPGAGAVTGTWNSSLPTNPLVTTLAVTVPGGATVINAIVLHGWVHTWSGDHHLVLTDPGGASYNLLVLANSSTSAGGGCSTDFSGDYTIIDPVATDICNGVGPFVCGGVAHATGTYVQSFSTWTSGSAGLSNTPLESIPLASGTWTLTIYDWYPPVDSGTLASWDMCFGSPTTPPPPPPNPAPTCVGTGATGAYPTSGAAGTWPTIMPTGQLVSPLAVTVPVGSTKIEAIKVLGWVHSWFDDTQVVLQDPNGNLYDILQANDGVAGGSCGDNLSGDYTFVDAINGVDQCGNPVFAPPGCSGAIPPGTYLQYYGAWPSGSSSIANTNLNAIPLASGTWNLLFYDWYVGADNGAITGWEMCFDSSPISVTDCQTLPTVTQGCSSSLSFSGSPSATSASAFTVTVGGLNAQVNGVVFYGVSGPNVAPWSSRSILCIKSPTQRMGTVAGAFGNSGGVIGSCNGEYSFDMNDVIQGVYAGLLATPMPAGQAVDLQGWQRDPASTKTTQLTDSLSFVVGT